MARKKKKKRAIRRKGKVGRPRKVGRPKKAKKFRKARKKKRGRPRMVKKTRKTARARRLKVKKRGRPKGSKKTTKVAEFKIPSRLKNIPKEEIIKEILDDFDDHMDAIPRLRQGFIAEVGKNPEFRNRLIARVIEELT